MADAVIAATIFQHHFPSMRAMQCDGEGDSGIVCMFDASWLIFILFVHFLLLAFVDASEQGWCTSEVLPKVPIPGALLPWAHHRSQDPKTPSSGGGNLRPERPEVMKLR